LIQPLEDFFNNVFVMAVSLRCLWITSVSAAAADPCWVSYWWCMSCTGRRENSQQPAGAAEKDWEFAQGNCRAVSFAWVLAGEPAWLPVGTTFTAVPRLWAYCGASLKEKGNFFWCWDFCPSRFCLHSLPAH
jgi:hypothetical protein